MTLEDLYREYHEALYRSTYGLLHQPEEAEDVVQETFCRACRAWEAVDPTDNLRAWLYRIARNLCIDRIRHDHLHSFVELEPWQAWSDPTEDEGETVREALSMLPALWQRALRLRYEEGYSLFDVARMLNISYTNSKMILMRARHLLRTYYERLERTVAA